MLSILPKFGFNRRFNGVKVAAMGTAAALIGLGVVGLTGGAVSADTTISGPIGLGNADSFAVLGGAAVTNTGTSTISGDAGVAPGTSLGLLAGNLTGGGALHAGDSLATNAQTDTTTAFNVAASLSPTGIGLTELGGNQSFGPGVYSGGALSVNGVMNLVGSADSVWVFQAASTLITGSSSSIVLSGGASSCNVFWEVGSSAVLGTNSTMVGTVMALTSISTDGGNTVNGRLLARNGAVTLINTNVNRPSGCTTPVGSVNSSPRITSGNLPTGSVGTPYTFSLTASGSGGSDFTVVSGSLAPGLSLDSGTGVISGTPTMAGTFPVTVSADNGIAPAGTADLRLAVLDTLALTGTVIHPTLEVGGIAVATGIAMLVLSRRRRPGHRV